MGFSPSEFLLRELRRRRVAAGLTQGALAERMHFSDTQVSAVETGARPPKTDFLKAADRVLETGDLFMNLWEELIKDAETPVWLREWIEIEREAVALRWFEVAFVPGLLQTEEYARATLLTSPLFTPEEVEQRVATRISRQEILHRKQPPHVVAVIDEAALRRTVRDDRKLMADQLTHLVTCAELPHVHVHVIPASAGLYSGLAGSFVLADLADGQTFGNVDHQVGAQIVGRATEIANLARAWETVRGEAIPRRQSLDLIREVASSWS